MGTESGEEGEGVGEGLGEDGGWDEPMQSCNNNSKAFIAVKITVIWLPGLPP